jgi:hypothetical protein
MAPWIKSSCMRFQRIAALFLSDGDGARVFFQLAPQFFFEVEHFESSFVPANQYDG